MKRILLFITLITITLLSCEMPLTDLDKLKTLTEPVVLIDKYPWVNMKTEGGIIVRDANGVVLKLEKETKYNYINYLHKTYTIGDTIPKYGGDNPIIETVEVEDDGYNKPEDIENIIDEISEDEEYEQIGF